MLPIHNENIASVGDYWMAMCKCGAINKYSTKNSALNMVERGSCRCCKKDYRSVNDAEARIYKNKNGKWCSTCSGCGTEQAYTRKDHAKQSSLSDWQCKKCVCAAKAFSANTGVGSFRRLYNKFEKSAKTRQIDWSLEYEDFCSIFNGRCALTGWPITTDYLNGTASLDRINSKLGYCIENVRWVHSMVNMSKNRYDDDLFIKMCVAVARNYNNKVNDK
jgi:hypothetical protein